MVLEVTRTFFADGAATYRYACAMYGFGAARNQVMPPMKFAAFVDQPIGAGRRHPGNLLDIAGREDDAIRYEALAFSIARASAGPQVEQPAGDVRKVYLPGLHILELQETATATAVAQGLPLLTGHFAKGFCFPERRGPGSWDNLIW